MFAKAEPHAYTEEAIAASRALENPGSSGRGAEQEPSPAGGAKAPHQAGAWAAEANGSTCAAVANSGAQDAPRLANGNARADADGTAACSPSSSCSNGACQPRPKGGKVAPPEMPAVARQCGVAPLSSAPGALLFKAMPCEQAMRNPGHTSSVIYGCLHSYDHASNICMVLTQSGRLQADQHQAHPMVHAQVCPSTGLPCACSSGSAPSGAPGSGQGAARSGAGHMCSTGEAPLSNGGAHPGAGARDRGGCAGTLSDRDGKSGAGERDGEGGDVVVSSSADKLAVGGSAAYARPSAEPIFPPALRGRVPPPLYLPGPAATWHRWRLRCCMLLTTLQRAAARLARQLCASELQELVAMHRQDIAGCSSAPAVVPTAPLSHSRTAYS